MVHGYAVPSARSGDKVLLRFHFLFFWSVPLPLPPFLPSQRVFSGNNRYSTLVLSEFPILFKGKNPLHRPVKEIPVMRYRNNNALIPVQIVLQDRQCGNIKIIGRLVHKISQSRRALILQGIQHKTHF